MTGRRPVTALAVAALTAALALPTVAAEGSHGPASPTPEDERPSIEGVTWQLESQAVDRQMSHVAGGVAVTLVLRDGDAAGHGGCNSYFASYELNGESLTFDRIGSTLMACEGPGGEVETAYLANLADVGGWASDETTLTLSDADGAPILEYEATPEVSLVGSWMAQSVNDGAEAVVSSAMTLQVTAEFGADGWLTGSDGCNSYVTTYEVEGDAITISPEIGATRMRCADEVMALAERYYAALLAATTWSIDVSGNLALRDTDGALQVLFQPAVG